MEKHFVCGKKHLIQRLRNASWLGSTTQEFTKTAHNSQIETVINYIQDFPRGTRFGIEVNHVHANIVRITVLDVIKPEKLSKQT
jgi:hypothetical protein